MIGKYFFKNNKIRYFNVLLLAIILSQLLVGYMNLSALIALPEIIATAMIYLTVFIVITMSLNDFIIILDGILKSTRQILLGYASIWKIVDRFTRHYSVKTRDNYNIIKENTIIPLRC